MSSISLNNVGQNVTLSMYPNAHVYTIYITFRTSILWIYSIKSGGGGGIINTAYCHHFTMENFKGATYAIPEVMSHNIYVAM